MSRHQGCAQLKKQKNKNKEKQSPHQAIGDSQQDVLER
jgi:hypothetical protein